MAGAYSLTRQVSLRALNTFGVDATAACVATLRDPQALSEVLARHEAREGAMVLGEGSNVLFVGDYGGTLLRLACDAVQVVAEDGEGALVRAEAGCRWDPLVDWTLARGLVGLENLALIPGLAGAAPIQNIGAYGVEVGEFVATVEAYDRGAGRVVRLAKDQCGFAYRESTFKKDPARWIVSAIELRLPRQRELALGYAGVADELKAMGVTQPTAAAVAEAVRRLRRRKLPDPARVGNAGSFFKNPVVPAEVAERLRIAHPQLPVYRAAQECKLSAAWLIEQCGWRGFREGDAGVSAQHALVLVNHGHATGHRLLELARRVAASVRDRFGVTLEPEPRIVGADF